MANEFYDHTNYPAPNTKATSAGMRAELDLIEAGFDKLPALSGNSGKKIVVNATGDGLTAVPDTSSAADVPFSPTGGIAATNVQAALAELDTEKAAASHNHDGVYVPVGATYAATAISFAPTGTIAATDVQAAIAELDSETQTALGGKSPTSHNHTGVYEPADATILKSAAIGTTVQGYDVDTAKTDVAQNFTAPQRSAPLTDNDLSFDLSAKQNFNCTWTGAGTLTFTNIASAAGQSGWIKFVQSGTGTVAAAAHSLITAANLTKLGAAGTYIASYYCDGTDVYVSIGTYA